MTTYYFAAGFDIGDPSEDQTHQDAEYGFSSTTGNGVVTPIGSSGTGGRQFEAVHIPAAQGGQPSQFAVVLFSSILQIDQAQSFFRVAFRPAHDVPPSSGLAVSPLNTSDTQTLLRGVTIGSRQAQNANVDGTNYGLPPGQYDTQFVFPGYQIVSGQPPNTSVHFELSIEIAILVGSTWSYYKVDPEMVIDY